MAVLYVRNTETGEFEPIRTIRGAPGEDGVDGKDGVNGSDGAPGKDGTNGTNGKDGADGKDGESGRGIVSMEWVNATQSLTVNYTDGTSQTVTTGMPDLSKFIPQRIVTSEPADSDIAEGEIVWVGEAT